MTEVIARIVFSVLELVREERRTRFKTEYHDILTALNEAKSTPREKWSDSTVDVLNLKLETFLLAFASEVDNEVSFNS